MMKRLLSSLFLSVVLLAFLPGRANAAGDVALNATNFPDANFRAVVAEEFDIDGNGSLSAAEISNATYLDCSNKGISSLNGVQFLTNLEELYCSGNQLTSLNVSNNPKLEVLICTGRYDNPGKVTSLNISGCTNLQVLSCAYNKLTNLDVSHLTNLTKLACTYNQLTSLDVSRLTNLTLLTCFNNQLTSLDVSRLTSLEYLDCGCNQLTSLNITNTKVGFTDNSNSDSSIVGSQNNNIAITVLMTESQKKDFDTYCADGEPYECNLRVNAVTKMTSSGPSITSQPKNVTLALGETGKFSVTATGNGLTYQWQYKSATGTAWSNSGNSTAKTATLEMKADSTRNGMQFRCVVKDSAGNTVTSNAATMTVKSGPAITTQPKNVTLALGETGKFTVAATGSDLTYQWQYKSATATTWSNSGSTSAKTATLEMKADTSRQGMQFRCVVKDSAGNTVTSNAATMTVKSGPAITTQPKNVTLALGETGKFTVAATGSDLTYQWQYKSATATAWSNSGNSTAKTATLEMKADSSRNGMQFRCVVTDASGNTATSNAATMTITSGPSITTQPKGVTVALGETGKFTVAASGNGLSYQWQYKSATATTWTNSGSTSAKTATLEMKADSSRQGMQFRCVVTDASGKTATSNAAAMTIKASITTQPKSVTLALGETGKFTVAAFGNGLSYQWQYKSATATTWTNSGSATAKTATLEMKADASRNGMQFRCVVKDSAGNSVTSNAATMTVNTKATITSQPKNVTLALGETGKFTVVATGSGLTYQWQYKSVTATAWSNSGSTSAKTATLEMKADSSRNGMQFRCVVKDSAGNSVTSSAATMIISNAAPVITAQPKSVSLAPGETGRFTVSAVGTGLSYQWQYKSAGSTTWKDSSSSSAKTAALSMTADSTRNGMQFRCIIKSSNGTSVTSSAATMTVAPKLTIVVQPNSWYVPLGATVNFHVEAIGDGLSYQWQYKSATATTWTNSSSTSAKTATLQMKADTSRHGMQFRCVITDAYGNSVTSDAVTMTIVANITSQPQNATVKAGETAKFTVGATGISLTYQWEYKIGTGYWTEATFTGAKAATLSIDAEGSMNGMQVRCRIKDVNGFTFYSDPAVLIIASDKLQIVSSPDDIMIQESAPVTFAVAATGKGLTYQWQYRPLGSSVWLPVTASGSITERITFYTQASDNGNEYRCLVRDSSGNSVYTKPACLSLMNGSIRLMEWTTRIYPSIDSTVTINVKAEGNGLTYQWQYRTPNSDLWVNVLTDGHDAPVLSVEARRYVNLTEFRCIIRSSSGSFLISTPCTLDIQ